MITMDVFKTDAFNAISLSAAVDKMGFVPSFLGSMAGLFDPVPVRTTDIIIEARSTDAAVIQTSPRGAPPNRKAGETRDARNFKTRRIAISDRIMADELQNMRAFGSETELQTVQAEVARRMMLLRRDVELTLENLRLGCVQGTVLDADGSTIYAWDTELGQTIPTEVDWDLDNASPGSGVVRTACNVARRSIIRGLKGLGGANVRVAALCGDTFWDNLTAHSEVRQTYLNWQAAADLRTGTAFSSFRYGDIDFYNYRGTDDGSTVGVHTDKAKFFPVGAGIFKMAYAPHASFDFVNTLGQPVYAGIVPDAQRNAYADVEVYSYPLPVCTMPQALYRARRT